MWEHQPASRIRRQMSRHTGSTLYQNVVGTTLQWDRQNVGGSYIRDNISHRGTFYKGPIFDELHPGLYSQYKMLSRNIPPTTEIRSISAKYFWNLVNFDKKLVNFQIFIVRNKVYKLLIIELKQINQSRFKSSTLDF